MNKDGAVVFDSEEEIAFIRQRIAENPRTLMALQFEINLMDQKLFKFQKEIQAAAKSEGTALVTIEWKGFKPLLDEYSSLLTRYPADVLAQQDLGAYIRIRMGSLYAYIQETEPDRVGKMKIGIQLLEEALEAAPVSPFRVEALEALALLAGRVGDDRKSFDTYKKLFLLTSQDPKAQRRKPADYMSGLKATATSKDMETEVIDLMQQIIDRNPPQSEECREARFYLAEMLFMNQRLSDAAMIYKDFVRIYGPTQTVDGVVVAGWERKVLEGPVLDQVYEAGLREAQCWRSQGHTANMLKAYRWMMANQNYKNPRVAEATYMSLITGVKIADLSATKKEELGRDLWTQVVNASIDFGSKAFQSGFYPWVRDPSAVPFVRVAVLKAAQLTADAGNHRRAAEMYQQYLKLFDPAKGGKFVRDEFFFMAAFAVGREYVLANDAVAMVDAFRVYLDGMRDSKFRAAALQLVGHYGTQAELYNDAADAYAALLDEYIQPSAASVKLGTAVPPEARLRKKSSWNGIRMTAPDGWDVSQIRFGLGYLYKQKEQWELCATTLLPFLTDASLRESSNRADALFTMGRCRMNLGQDKDGSSVVAHSSHCSFCL
jgi:TolA-binding protein